MNQHQLARNSQVQAARQRLAQRQVPGGAYGANVAGCGPNFNQGYFPVGPNDPQQGWYPVPVMNMDIANVAPPIPAANYANPYGALKRDLVPLGFCVESGPDPVTIEVSCRGGSYFYAGGISTCNECFQIKITAIEIGGCDYNIICGDGVDAGLWNTDDCYCPLDLGCISNFQPAVISFEAFNSPSVFPFLNGALWGVRICSWQQCSTIAPWQVPPGLFPGNGAVPPGINGGGGAGGPQGHLGAPGGGMIQP